MAQFDIVIRNGRVMDPGSSRDGIGDICISNGRIVESNSNLAAEDAVEVIDAKGLLVTPGLIDLHAHACIPGLGLGLDLDPVCLSTGVTTLVDGGSTGAATFPLLQEFIIERAQVDVIAFVHISSIGQMDEEVGESTYLDLHDVDRAVAICREYPQLIVGVKVRLGRDNVGTNGLVPLELAKEAARRGGGVPVMVHVTDPVVPYAEILSRLDGGDVVSHYLQASGTGLLDEDGLVCRAAWRARDRGVVFDVCHGRRHLNFKIARASLSQGFPPDVLSTDLTRISALGIAKNLPYVMSKFLCLGQTLQQVLEAVTATPARLLSINRRKGHLNAGATADVALFTVREGTFEYTDSQDEVIIGNQILEPEMTIKSGRVAWRRGDD